METAKHFRHGNMGKLTIQLSKGCIYIQDYVKVTAEMLRLELYIQVVQVQFSAWILALLRGFSRFPKSVMIVTYNRQLIASLHILFN
jgi:hypothetical protein